MVVLVLAVILIPIVLCVILPSEVTPSSPPDRPPHQPPLQVNTFMGSATIRLIHAQISNATATQFHLDSVIEIGNTGPVAASLKPFTATLLFEGDEMGSMPFPGVEHVNTQ